MKSIEDKISDITSLATNASLNAKTNVVKGKISSITNLATTAAVTITENKSFSDLKAYKENLKMV